MKKLLLTYSFTMAMLLSVPVAYAMAAEMLPAITEQTMDDDVNISVSGQTISVLGGQGQTLEVVSLTGRCVMSVKIDSPAQKIELNIPKGCYILKIGKVVRKVTIR